MAVRFRRGLYQAGLMPVHALSARVVSVGNISMGGTGKTPVVSLIAKHLAEGNQRVVVLTRGYGRTDRGHKILCGGVGSWREVGDEPLMLSRALPAIPIVIDRDRVAGGKLAVERFHPRFIILDDGLQHLRLARDVEVVVIDATSPFGNGRLFPRGILREDLGALRRANLFLLTKVNQTKGIDGLVNFLRRTYPQVPIIQGAYEPQSLRNVMSHEQLSPASLRGKLVMAMSSIGNPISFEHSLEQLGTQVVEKIRFPDHHPYCQEDLATAAYLARKSGARYVVTTEKDEMRLPTMEEPEVPILSLGIQLKVVSEEKQLWDLIERGSLKWP